MQRKAIKSHFFFFGLMEFSKFLKSMITINVGVWKWAFSYIARGSVNKSFKRGNSAIYIKSQRSV